MNTLAYAGYIIGLIGSVILILFGLLGFLSIILVPFSPLYYLGVSAHGLITLIIGIVGIIAARYVARLEWAIVLIILGVIAAGIGGTLLVLAGLLGLLSRLIK
jgi:hypothetical protein